MSCAKEVHRYTGTQVGGTQVNKQVALNHLHRNLAFPSRTRAPSPPAEAHTSFPSLEADRSNASAFSVRVLGEVGLPPSLLGLTSQTQIVWSAAALHIRHRSFSPSGDHTGSIVRSEAPPPGIERRHSAVRASHSLIEESSEPDRTMDAPGAGFEGGAPGVHMHETAPRWPVSIARHCSVAPDSTAIRPSACPAHSSSSQPKPSAAPFPRGTGPDRSAIAGRTVSTMETQKTLESSWTAHNISPEIVLHVLMRPHLFRVSPPHHTCALARQVSIPQRWRGARVPTQRSSMSWSSRRPSVRDGSLRRISADSCGSRPRRPVKSKCRPRSRLAKSTLTHWTT